MIVIVWLAHLRSPMSPYQCPDRLSFEGYRQSVQNSIYPYVLFVNGDVHSWFAAKAHIVPRDFQKSDMLNLFSILFCLIVWDRV